MCRRSTALPLGLLAVVLAACTTVQPTTSDAPGPRPAGGASPAIPTPSPIEGTTPAIEDDPEPARRDAVPLPPPPSTPTPPPPAPGREVPAPPPAPAPPVPPVPRMPAPVRPVTPAPPTIGYEPGAVCDMGQEWMDDDLAVACRDAFR